MENILCEDYSVKKQLVNIKHQLLNVDSKHNKKNMNSVIPSQTGLDDYKHAYINHPNENPFINDNICRESDESDESDEYDSDCSLGSLNSLYLRLKNNSKAIDLNTTDRVCTKQLQPAICKLSKTDSFPEKNDAKETNTSKKIMTYDKTEHTKPTKLSTNIFYGKQVMSIMYKKNYLLLNINTIYSNKIFNNKHIYNILQFIHYYCLSGM